MGYHDARELPNYWAWAHDFVLQDHLFQSDTSWSLPAHLYLVSGWSARCSKKGDPMSCRPAVQAPGLAARQPAEPDEHVPDYAWTDLTYLLHRDHVSWGYYVFNGTAAGLRRQRDVLQARASRTRRRPGIWNPLPCFDTVKQDHQLGNIRPFRDFLAEAKAGTLPAVSWITPTQKVSDHPPALISDGQTYVTGLIDRIMRSPDWSSTAIFLAWDDWGGFYDHVVPPTVDAQGYGLRVPGPPDQPVRAAAVHRPPDAQLRRLPEVHRGRLPRRRALDPKTDGRPDPRPGVRENATDPRQPRSRSSTSPRRRALPHPADPPEDRPELTG